MKYPYFRGLEADRYSFYRVPKALIKVDLFEKMSGDAKLLYAVLLDRMNLSLKNGWQDENGNAYIICTIDEIMDSIRFDVPDKRRSNCWTSWNTNISLLSGAGRAWESRTCSM